MINMVKLPTNNKRMILRVARGHFATSHSHINYYIDVTMQKTRLSEAAETAKELVHMYKSTTIVDTILCLDGTQVIGTCMANELTKDGFRNMNAHQTIYIITPEYTSGSQIILRDNIAPMVRGRHVLILSASITTGYSIKAAVEAVQYYGGQVAGLAAIFASTCLEHAAALGAEAMKGGPLTDFELACDNGVSAYLSQAKTKPFGIEPAAEYLALLEGEITAARMILTGRLAGIEPEVVRGRLRDVNA